MIRRIAAAVWLACAAIACASGPPRPVGTEGLPAPSPGMGRLVLYRPHGSDLPLFHPPLAIDGAAVGDLPVGTFLYVDRPPGIHVISIQKQPNVSAFGGQAPTRPIEIEIAPEATAYLRFDVYVTPVWVESSLTTVDPIAAQRELATLGEAGSGD